MGRFGADSILLDEPGIALLYVIEANHGCQCACAACSVSHSAWPPSPAQYVS